MDTEADHTLSRRTVHNGRILGKPAGSSIDALLRQRDTGRLTLNRLPAVGEK